MKNLNEIEIFAKVGQAGSFSRAAKELGMPVSTVSRKVADLEKRLGLTLIQRTTRKLNLTHVGSRYLDRCVELLVGLEEIEEQITEEHQEPEGLLRISTPVGMSTTTFMDLIAGFLTRYPRIRIDLVVTNAFVDLVAENIDLAIRFGTLEDSSLIAKRLGRAPNALVASRDYLKRYGIPKEPEDLKHHECLIYTGEDEWTTWDLISGSRKRSVKVKGRASASDLLALKHLAISGLGIALLPQMYLGEESETAALVSVLDHWKSPFADAFAVYPTRRYMPGRLTAFLRELETWGSPYWEK